MFCTNCGKEIDNNSLFCTHCGSKQTREAAAPEIKPQAEIVEEPQAESTESSASEAPLTDATPVSEETPVTSEEATIPTSEAAVVPNNVEVPVGPEEEVVNEAPVPAAEAVTPAPAPVTPAPAPVTPAPAPVTPAVQPSAPAPATATQASTPRPIVSLDEPQKTNTKSKSNLIVYAIIAVAVIIAGILLFGKGGGGYTDYKTLVKDYYNAIYNKDFNALLKCYDKDDQKDLKEDKEGILDEMKDLKDTYNDRFERSWNKKVVVSGKSKIDSEDGFTTYSVVVVINKDQDNAEIVTIKKDNDKEKYYIDSTNDAF